MNKGKLNLSALNNFNESASFTSVKINSIIEKKEEIKEEIKAKPRFSLRDLKPENCCLKIKKEQKQEIKIDSHPIFKSEKNSINKNNEEENFTSLEKNKDKITLSKVSIKKETIEAKSDKKANKEEKKVLFSDWHTHSFMGRNEEEEIFANYSCDNFQDVKEVEIKAEENVEEKNKKQIKKLDIENFKEEKTIVIESKINKFLSFEDIQKIFKKKAFLSALWVFSFAVFSVFIWMNMPEINNQTKVNIIENNKIETQITQDKTIKSIQKNPWKITISEEKEKEILWDYLKDIYKNY